MSFMTDFELLVFEKNEVTCNDVEKLFGEYIENETPCSLRARLDEHIQSCENCQRFQEQYKTVISLAKELGSRPIPEDVQQRLRKSLNERLGLSLS